MGIFRAVSHSSFESSSATAPAPVAGNPNPNNWKLVKYKEMAGYLIVQLNYPDCKNYEGNKILVFEGISLADLINQKTIDPHFFPNKTGAPRSPVARFTPDTNGWTMAEVLANGMRPIKQNR